MLKCALPSELSKAHWRVPSVGHVVLMWLKLGACLRPLLYRDFMKTLWKQSLSYGNTEQKDVSPALDWLVPGASLKHFAEKRSQRNSLRTDLLLTLINQRDHLRLPDRVVKRWKGWIRFLRYLIGSHSWTPPKEVVVVLHHRADHKKYSLEYHRNST